MEARGRADLQCVRSLDVAEAVRRAKAGICAGERECWVRVNLTNALIAVSLSSAVCFAGSVSQSSGSSAPPRSHDTAPREAQRDEPLLQPRPACGWRGPQRGVLR